MTKYMGEVEIELTIKKISSNEYTPSVGLPELGYLANLGVYPNPLQAAEAAVRDVLSRRETKPFL